MTDETLEPLFRQLVAADASDLHLCEGEAPVMRVHGFLKPVELPPSVAAVPFAELTARLIGRGNFETFRAAREFDVGQDRVAVFGASSETMTFTSLRYSSSLFSA